MPENKFKASKDRFDRIEDGKYFSPLAEATLNVGIDGRYIEYRQRVTDGTLCIVEFYPDGKEYAIYVQEGN